MVTSPLPEIGIRYMWHELVSSGFWVLGFVQLAAMKVRVLRAWEGRARRGQGELLKTLDLLSVQ